MAEIVQKKIYDLEERTTVFSEKIIVFCKSLPKNILTIPIINQLLRSATSIGANYMEANGASSRKDFKHKIYICKKEAKETMYWLRLLENMITNELEECKKLSQEAKELTLIFSTIAANTN